MENKTGQIFTDNTPRYDSKPRLFTRTPDEICIQLKARHYVTCPANDLGFVSVEDDCMGCGCYDCTNSTEHTIHCSGIMGKWDRERLHQRKDKIIEAWIESDGELE